MTITWYESFTGVDWERYATRGGHFAAISLIGFSVLLKVLDYSWELFFVSIFVSLFVTLLEIPALFVLVPHVSIFRDILMEKCFFQRYAVRGAFYLLFSLICFQAMSPLVPAGVALLAVGILYIFAHVNKQSDISDASVHGQSQTRLVPKGFGTFQSEAQDSSTP